MLKPLSIFSISIFLMLTGCGTGNLGTMLPSTFEGQWKGTWVDAVNAQQGTMEMIISSNGTVSANTHNSTLNMNGVGEATISSSGDTTGQYSYPGGSYKIKGKISINNSGHLVGIFQEYSGNMMVGSLSVDLVKQ